MDGDEGRRTKDEGGGGGGGREGRDPRLAAPNRRLHALSAPVNEGNSRRLTLDRDAAFLLSRSFCPRCFAPDIIPYLSPTPVSSPPFCLVPSPSSCPTNLPLAFRASFPASSIGGAAGHLCPSARRDTSRLMTVEARNGHFPPCERTRPLITLLATNGMTNKI